jgi:hypothetical protein
MQKQPDLILKERRLIKNLGNAILIGSFLLTTMVVFGLNMALIPLRTLDVGEITREGQTCAIYGTAISDKLGTLTSFPGTGLYEIETIDEEYYFALIDDTIADDYSYIADYVSFYAYSMPMHVFSDSVIDLVNHYVGYEWLDADSLKDYYGDYIFMISSNVRLRRTRFLIYSLVLTPLSLACTIFGVCRHKRSNKCKNNYTKGRIAVIVAMILGSVVSFGFPYRFTKMIFLFILARYVMQKYTEDTEKSHRFVCIITCSFSIVFGLIGSIYYTYYTSVFQLFKALVMPFTWEFLKITLLTWINLLKIGLPIVIQILIMFYLYRLYLPVDTSIQKYVTSAADFENTDTIAPNNDQE